MNIRAACPRFQAKGRNESAGIPGANRGFWEPPLLTGQTAPLNGGLPKRRTISAEGRARMGAAQKARWAKAEVTCSATPCAGGLISGPPKRPTQPAW